MDLLIPNSGLLFWMTLVFLIVAVIVIKFGFPVIINMVNERKEYIDDSLRKAKEANQKLSNIQKEGESVMQQAREQQALLLKEATATRDAIVGKAQDKAHEESARIIAEAKTEIEAEKQNAFNDIRGQVAEISVKVAEQILRGQLADNMDIGVISVRYARALLKGAMVHQQEDEIYHEIQTLLGSYSEVAELRFTIDNPMLPKDKKQELLEVATGGNVSELLKTFFALVLREGREGILLFIANSYITLYRKQKNIIQGKLTTAVPVTPSIEEKMKDLVHAKAQGTVEFNTNVDPDIIGGFILEYDTYKMDASVKTKLNAVLTQLKK